MQKKPYISMPVIRRLPRYYRFLRHLDKRGVTRISSKELSEKMGFTASQVRQDFNCFGGYGQQGYATACTNFARRLALFWVWTVHTSAF